MISRLSAYGFVFARPEIRFWRRITIACWAFVVFSAFVLVTPAAAQSASFRSVDTNSDGVLSRSELIATFGERGARRLLERSDHNGDGQLTIWELRRDRKDRSEADEEEHGDRRNDDDDDDDDSDDEDGGDDDGNDSGDGDDDDD